MDVWSSLAGFVQLQITSPEPQKFLGILTDNDIEVYDIYDSNDLTVFIKVSRRKYKTVQILARRSGADVKITGRYGVFWSIRRVVLRPVMVISLLLLFVTVFYLPRRICFVQIQGNEFLPDNLILDCAQECGICFGALRSEVRSERVKNLLLSKIPQVQWIGVNTQGCTAVITVREKSIDDTIDTDKRIRSIVAVCDGVIDQCTVIKGNALCKPGIAVKEGQVLVSAYTDCGIAIRAERAEAEIFGATKRNIQVLTPTHMTFRNGKIDKRKKYSIIIGKKQIKFYKGSGISDRECVKMKTVKYLVLPGGFKLPIALVTECVETYEKLECAEISTDWVERYAESYLRSIMISGRILSSVIDHSCSTDVYHLTGVFDCHEIIGIPRYEETVK